MSETQMNKICKGMYASLTRFIQDYWSNRNGKERKYLPLDAFN